MEDAGYGQYADSTPYFARANRGLAFAQPAGPWGYIGTALAAQYGFTAPSDSNDAQSSGPPATPAASLPAGAQAAAGKCINIVAAFNNDQFATSLVDIETTNDDLSTDVIQDPDFKKAMRAWSACMARNGYSYPDAGTLSAAGKTLRAAPGSEQSRDRERPPRRTKAQIATAVTDADCTQATDLAGIYFAVQAGSEQQLVAANQQALNAAVRQYKAAFAKGAETSSRRCYGRRRPHPSCPERPAAPADPGTPGKPGQARPNPLLTASAGLRPRSPTRGDVTGGGGDDPEAALCVRIL